MTGITLYHDPQPERMGVDVVEFVESLGGPGCLVIPGLDRSRSRMVVTLLHGNEPSGAIALHRWLSDPQRERPAVDTYCVVMNVAAAMRKPLFSHRQVPGLRDLNRCFRPPYADAPGKLAESLIELIHRVQPEALIDIHNTTGIGPAFGVAVFFDQRHDALVSYFSQRLIITDLRLGALMEFSEREVPSVTVECGGSQDEESHCIAYEGLMRWVTDLDVFAIRGDWPLELLHNPVRLELHDSLEVVYVEEAYVEEAGAEETYAEEAGAEASVRRADLSLRVDIEHFNFGEVDRSTLLGWVRASAWDRISVIDSQGENLRDEYLRLEDGCLYPAARLKLFMITGNSQIAKSDCLLYAVKQATELPAAESG